MASPSRCGCSCAAAQKAMAIPRWEYAPGFTVAPSCDGDHRKGLTASLSWGLSASPRRAPGAYRIEFILPDSKGPSASSPVGPTASWHQRRSSYGRSLRSRRERSPPALAATCWSAPIALVWRALHVSAACRAFAGCVDHLWHAQARTRPSPWPPAASSRCGAPVPASAAHARPAATQMAEV